MRKLRATCGPGPCFPSPPDDVEKYAYISRALPYLSTWLTAGFFFPGGKPGNHRDTE